MTDNLIYLFEIVPADGTTILLTSYEQDLIKNNRTYLKYSGLNIESAYFNDSAEDQLIIAGIFEEGGISKNTDIAGSQITISTIIGRSTDILASLICIKCVENDLNFSLYCAPQTIKYQRSLLHSFSKTCRAVFDDNKCKVPKDDLSTVTTIREIHDNIITCDLVSNKPDDYYKNGTMVVQNPVVGGTQEVKIISYINNKIQLYGINHPYLKKNIQIKITPGCNKNYRTCCYYFNNAVNFRGEPFIPEYNTLKN